MIVKEIRLYAKNDVGFLLTLLAIVALETRNVLDMIHHQFHFDFPSYFDSNFHMIQFSVFLIMIYMTIQVCRYHDLDTVWILRYKSRSQYMGKLLKKVWIHNGIVYFFIIFITCIISYITFTIVGDSTSIFQKTYLEGLGMPYCIFQTIAYYFLMQLLLSIFVLLLKYLPKVISYISLVVILFFSFSSIENVPINGIKDMILTPNGYIYSQRFQNFFLQIGLTGLYLFFLSLIGIALYRVLRHRKFDIG